MIFQSLSLEISNANDEIRTEEESEINTGSTSSFEIASNMCIENGEEFEYTFRNDEEIRFEMMKMRKNNMKLLIKNIRY